eukprot:scaffold23368_cov71-Cyclotella_meneghiniana.AAC.4
MQPVDPNKLAELHLCVKCRKLPKSVVAATDENLYCRTCIEGVLSAASSGDIIQSPATGEVIGRKLTTPVTIQALINDLMACGNLDKKYVWSDSEDANSSSVLETIQKKAKAGSARHMTILGRWYLFGEKEGIEGNEDEAYKWCKQADNLDDVDGYCLLHGYGTVKNIDEGRELLVDACSQGSDFAAYILGSCYHTGLYGFTKNAKKAVKFLEKARDMKHKRGTACTLKEADLGNITRYLCVYDSKPKQLDTQIQDGNIDSSSIPSQVGERTVQETTISSLSFPS